MGHVETLGRRERKKAATRTAISDAALRLFLARGYDQVSVKEIADAADVAVTTLFKHFPGKEALVFDQDADLEAALVAAVRDRTPDQSVVAALRAHLTAVSFRHLGEPGFQDFLRLVNETPALRDYSHRMWMRHEQALAEAIAETTGAPPDDLASAALAHFVLAARTIVQTRENPVAALAEVLDLLATGWAS
jgi:AcrR family transcriptional regulator